METGDLYLHAAVGRQVNPRHGVLNDFSVLTVAITLPVN
jgi:hypothetical protein